MLRITLYSKPGCFGCRKPAEKFTAAGVPFDEVDLTATPAALEYVTEDLGYSQVRLEFAGFEFDLDMAQLLDVEKQKVKIIPTE